MSRTRSRTANSVSLFPFLAVLVCAMGALIFLLIVTTRRIRSEAVEKSIAAQQAVEKHKATGRLALPAVDTSREIEFIPPPIEAPEPPPVEAPAPIIASPTITIPELTRLVSPEPIIAAKLKPVEVDPPRAPVTAPDPPPVDPNIALRARIAKLTASQTAARNRAATQRAASRRLKQNVDAVRVKLTRVVANLAEIEKRRLAQIEQRNEIENQRKAAAERAASTQRQIEAARRLNANASSKFAFVPFDGSSGTVRRPILIECTADGIRFLPEGVTLTPADLEGFTPGYNPLLAGASSLVNYWTAQSRNGAGGADEPEPYVLLVVRPGGTSSYYVARALLSKMRTPFGYELIEADWRLDLPEADADAVNLCRSSTSRVIARRQQLQDELSKAFGGPALQFKPGRGFEVDDDRDDVNPFDRRAVEAARRARESEPARRAREAGRTTSRVAEFAKNSEASTRVAKSTRNSHAAKTTESNGTIRTNVANASRRDGQGSIGTAMFPSDRRAAMKSNTFGGPGDTNSFPSLTRSGAGRATLRQRQETSDLGNDQQGFRAGEIPNLASTGDNAAGQSIRSGIVDPATRSEAQSSPFGRNGGTDTQSNSSDGFVAPKRTFGGPGGSGVAQGGQPGAGDGRPGASNSQSSGSSGADCPECETGQPTGPQTRFGSTGARKPPMVGRPNVRRWGGGRGGIGYEREVTISLEADRLSVGASKPKALGRGETRQQLIDAVERDILHEVRNWGAAPQGFYWIPRVRFVVSPGGNQHLERIRGPLERLGLQAEVEQRLNLSGAADGE